MIRFRYYQWVTLPTNCFGFDLELAISPITYVCFSFSHFIIFFPSSVNYIIFFYTFLNIVNLFFNRWRTRQQCCRIIAPQQTNFQQLPLLSKWLHLSLSLPLLSSRSILHQNHGLILPTISILSTLSSLLLPLTLPSFMALFLIISSTAMFHYY